MQTTYPAEFEALDVDISTLQQIKQVKKQMHATSHTSVFRQPLLHQVVPVDC